MESYGTTAIRVRWFVKANLPKAINIKGVYSMAHHFIKTQDNPQQPVGTFITTNSGLGGLVVPGMSGYGTSKLAAQRLVEFLDAGKLRRLFLTFGFRLIMTFC